MREREKNREKLEENRKMKGNKHIVKLDILFLFVISNSIYYFSSYKFVLK